jgi:Epoxide hydrolase N terminus
MEAIMEKDTVKTNDAITPFTLAVPQADLGDLNRRIDQTRWPDAETVEDWRQGAPLAKVKALVDHWRHRYDWRRCEAMLNNYCAVRHSTQCFPSFHSSATRKIGLPPEEIDTAWARVSFPPSEAAQLCRASIVGKWTSAIT